MEEFSTTNWLFEADALRKENAALRAELAALRDGYDAEKVKPENRQKVIVGGDWGSLIAWYSDILDAWFTWDYDGSLTGVTRWWPLPQVAP
jgi:hypothetical protein